MWPGSFVLPPDNVPPEAEGCCGSLPGHERAPVGGVVAVPLEAVKAVTSVDDRLARVSFSRNRSGWASKNARKGRPHLRCIPMELCFSLRP